MICHLSPQYFWRYQVRPFKHILLLASPSFCHKFLIHNVLLHYGVGFPSEFCAATGNHLSDIFSLPHFCSKSSSPREIVVSSARLPLNTGSVRPTQGRTCVVLQVNGGSQSHLDFERSIVELLEHAKLWIVDRYQIIWWEATAASSKLSPPLVCGQSQTCLLFQTRGPETWTNSIDLRRF